MFYLQTKYLNSYLSTGKIRGSVAIARSFLGGQAFVRGAEPKIYIDLY